VLPITQWWPLGKESSGALQVDPQQVGQDALVGFAAGRGQGVVLGEGLGGAGFGPEVGPVFGPGALGVGGGVGGQDGGVEGLVGQVQPGGRWL
jgi:hypothetical protein